MRRARDRRCHLEALFDPLDEPIQRGDREVTELDLRHAGIRLPERPQAISTWFDRSIGELDHPRLRVLDQGQVDPPTLRER